MQGRKTWSSLRPLRFILRVTEGGPEVERPVSVAAKDSNHTCLDVRPASGALDPTCTARGTMASAARRVQSVEAVLHVKRAGGVEAVLVELRALAVVRLPFWDVINSRGRSNATTRMIPAVLQGYLAHKKPPHPSTLQ